ncbi:CU044_2847 family protein [Nocardiopsis baichengensis]|uniref:CU044_2847 family protein n=1 Tax=Nocardiopsis baichengensis TaxID=280240 RepID=UPI001EF9D94E|nr:CU044_2847 family protein [Nocardiopsis baichengensis]
MAEIVRFPDEQGGEDAYVLIEAAGSSPQMRDVSGRDILRSADETAQKVFGRIRDLSALVARELRDLPGDPDEVTVELGVNVSAEADVFIAKTASQGGIKVTLTWRSGRGRV